MCFLPVHHIHHVLGVNTACTVLWSSFVRLWQPIYPLNKQSTYNLPCESIYIYHFMRYLNERYAGFWIRFSFFRLFAYRYSSTGTWYSMMLLFKLWQLFERNNWIHSQVPGKLNSPPQHHDPSMLLVTEAASSTELGSVGPLPGLREGALGSS